MPYTPPSNTAPLVINPTTGTISGFGTGGGLTLHGGGTITGASGSLDLAPLAGKTATFNYASLATTSTDGLVLANTTVALVGTTVQISPRLRLTSNAWDADNTVSRPVRFFTEVLGVSGNTVTGTYKLGYMDPITNALSYPLMVDNGGVLTLLGPLKAGATDSLGWNGTLARIYSPANGVIRLTNASASGFDRLSMGAEGVATTSSKLQKKVTAIADNTATAILTVTVPNANHAALIKLTLLTSNGGTDAFESSRTSTGEVVLARTSGVDCVAAVSALVSQIATVGSGATHTTAVGVSAMTGAADAQQTFTIQVTIDDSGNLGGNQCVVLAEVLNAEATGVTIA